MFANSINTNPAYLEYLNSNANSIRKNNNIKLELDEKTFLKSTAKAQRETVVSEKLDENRSIEDYNLRLQQNTPAAKLLGTIKAYNETNKIKKFDYEKDSENIIELTETDDYEKVRNSFAGEGYYIVITDRKTNADKNRLKNSVALWQERINNTYRLGLKKQPGILVNLVI